MTFSLRRLLHERREHARFKALPDKVRSIVFYNENEGYLPHLWPILEHLTKELERDVCYVTSSEKDPLLTNSHAKIHPFYIGDGLVRTSFFMSLISDMMIMTMPDLQTFHIKRSKFAPVHYVYIFHSIVSTHMIYRESAFDHFDTILTVGPHHEAEIRATETAYGLGPKSLVPHGSGRLDTIINENRNRPRLKTPGSGEKIRLLVAPSWGPEGLIETRGAELAKILLQGGYEVIFRLHPMTARKWPESINSLRQFEDCEGFRLEMDVSSQESLYSSHLLISDWSGIALEFAFGLERPVIYINVPHKINNSAYTKIEPTPIEISIRERIGDIVEADKLADIGCVIDRLCSDLDSFRERIRDIRASTVHNIGNSGQSGAEIIDGISRRIQKDAQ